MEAKCIAQGLGFCFTEFGEFGSRIHDWAVVLAQLNRLPAIGGALDGGCVARISQHLGQLIKGSHWCLSARLDVHHQLVRASASKSSDTGATVLLRQEPQGLNRKTVVFLTQCRMPGGGKAEHLTGSTAPAHRGRTVGSALGACDQAICNQSRQ